MWARVFRKQTAPKKRAARTERSLRAANEIEERAVIGINKETEASVSFSSRKYARSSSSEPTRLIRREFAKPLAFPVALRLQNPHVQRNTAACRAGS